MFRIVSVQALAPTVARFEVEAPFIARKRKPGNFVMVRLDSTGERIPLTLADSDPTAGTITLIVQAVGKTTKQLCAMRAGDSILDVVGPLGTPTPIASHGTVVCIGGGVGTAELYPIARALKEAGNTVISIVGARTRNLVILEKEMEAISNRLYITTDDGSYGTKGFVTDRLSHLLEAKTGIGAVYAIGPLPMMRAVSTLTRADNVPTLVSLNTIMIDGTGMCGGCRVTVHGAMKFACVDGPEFDGHGVDFDELMMRNRTYADLERVADETHACRLAAVTQESVR
jgi:ferredoxin--NADP+ reductase